MAITGPELLLDLAPGGPLRERIEVALRAAIREGRLRPGDRLPATRSLAAELGCSRGVVVEAYEQLAAEGWIEGRAGSGTRVRGERPAADAPGQAPARARPRRAPAPGRAGPAARARAPARARVRVHGRPPRSRRLPAHRVAARDAA